MISIAVSFAIMLAIIVLVILFFRKRYKGIHEDLLVAVQKAEAANYAKSLFLAKMSHEIRTPLNVIIGMAELALREDISHDAYKQIDTIKHSGAHLLSIVNDILDFSKIESGKLQIVRVDYYFSSLINDVINIIKMRVMERHISFTVNIDSKIPNALRGDETRIRQILLNILSNAVKYTDKGFIALTVTGLIADENSVELTMEIADSGIGIRKENIGKIFDDFVHIDKGHEKAAEGTGLGLAITKNLAQAMGGDISVSSEYGRGSVFTVRLPQQIRWHGKLATVKNPEKKAVLVYELRAIYAQSIAGTLENLGVEYRLVFDDSEFKSEISLGKWAFAFVASDLYGTVMELCETHKTRMQTVLLTGEAVSSRNVNFLIMPVYAISVANMLNGVSDKYFAGDNDMSVVRFIAPDARVLLVDDIQTNLYVVEGLLRPYKMQMCMCNSGKEAIEAVKKTKFDLVFMDHMMPEMDGIEAVAHIRVWENENGAEEVPVIALTANAVSGTSEMFMENGFNGFLPKPINTVKLNAVLEKWIPAEKQKKHKEQITVITEKDVPNIVIEGLDIKKGLAMMGGKAGGYMHNLAVFYNEGYDIVAKLKLSLETRNLPLYLTYIHAIKGAASNIGAKVSRDAGVLEDAGKNNDLLFIETHNADFMAKIESLLSNIGKAISAYSGEESMVEVDREMVKTELVRLKTALAVLDSGAIDKACESLRLYADNNETGFSDNIKAILHEILIGEYDEAVSRINSVITAC